MRAGFRAFRAPRAALWAMAALWAWLAMPLPALAEPLVVVAHPALEVTDMDLELLGDIYLGRRKFIANTRLQPVEYPDTNPLLDQFLGHVGMSANQYQRYWIRQIFRGNGTPPRKVADPLTAGFAIRTTPGAIGYLPESALGAEPGLRRLLVLPD